MSVLNADAVAQDERYRVEILVLTHLDHDAEPREFRNLDDYSGSIDYLAPPPPPEEESEEHSEAEITDEAQVTALPGAEDGLAEERLQALADELPEAPPRVLHIEEMSELMKENWRRLRLSAPFRPQQFLAWEQAADEPFPALRMHNLEIVHSEDPWAEERALLEQEAMELAEEAATDEEDEPGLPDPVLYYQLDGTITLRRSRFLHLDIRLDWREPVFGDSSPVESSLAEGSPAEGGYDEPAAPEQEPQQPVAETFRVHRLEQSRLVRTGRLEYFDHPVLGVLAIVSRIEAPAE